MKHTVLFLATALTISIGYIATSSLTTSAQSAGSNASGQALEISPPVLNLTARPGQTLTAQVSLRDISSTSLIVTGQVNDFVSGGEDGTPKILLDEDEANPYSLQDWVAPLPELTLQPRQIENLPVTINVPANAAPGGYYGVIRFTATPPELEGQGVSLSASLGALVLLRVTGDVKESLAIEEFTVSRNGSTGTLFESTPLQFIERIKNTGSIHLQPAGQVTITDMFGKKVAAVNVNLPPRNILPQSIRKFEQPLDSGVLGNKKLFGRYTADLRITYGEDKQEVTASTTFWVIPYKLIGIAIAVLIIGFIALRFAIRRYNQHIIKQARKK